MNVDDHSHCKERHAHPHLPGRCCIWCPERGQILHLQVAIKRTKHKGQHKRDKPRWLAVTDQEWEYQGPLNVVTQEGERKHTILRSAEIYQVQLPKKPQGNCYAGCLLNYPSNLRRNLDIKETQTPIGRIATIICPESTQQSNTGSSTKKK